MEPLRTVPSFRKLCDFTTTRSVLILLVIRIIILPGLFLCSTVAIPLGLRPRPATVAVRACFFLLYPSATVLVDIRDGIMRRIATVVCRTRGTLTSIPTTVLAPLAFELVRRTPLTTALLH